jgi:hypothetical protein
LIYGVMNKCKNRGQQLDTAEAEWDNRTRHYISAVSYTRSPLVEEVFLNVYFWSAFHAATVCYCPCDMRSGICF